MVQSTQERERLDTDLEQEQPEQEYGLLAFIGDQNERVYSPDIREHMTGLEAVVEEEEEEEDVEYENRGREQHDSAMSSDEEQVHHELVTPTHQNPSESGQIEVIGFTFWSFERGGFRVASYIRVEPSDTSPIERIAKKYMRKGFSLYDHLQHSVSPAACFRAGTVDCFNAIYMFSTEEEKKLVAERQLAGAMALIPRIPETPERPLKRRQLE